MLHNFWLRMVFCMVLGVVSRVLGLPMKIALPLFLGLMIALKALGQWDT